MTSPDPRLVRVESVIQADGFETRLAEREGDQPADSLLVAITDDDGHIAWQLELSFLPDMEEQLDGLGLLQCFVAVAADIADGSLPALREAIVALNAQLPLVGFGVVSEPRMAMFRSLVMTPVDDASADAVILQTTWMISYLLTLYGTVVAAVAAGTPFRDAIGGHPHAQLFL